VTDDTPPADESDTSTGSDPTTPADDWEVLDSVVEYETGWYQGGYDLLEQPDGTRKKYYWAEIQPAVVIVAVADGELVVVEQFRPAIGEHCIELPAGLVENGESYTTAGARELREETGFEAAGVSLLEEFWVATGVLRHRRGIVFAEGLEPGTPTRDSNEFLTVRTLPVEDALDVARAEPANDATIEGILLADEEGLL
jgi:ADP-ribose pyrophosphatase